FTLDMPIRNEKMGLGLMAYTDAIGKARTTGINIPYAYRMRMGTRTTLALGAQFGLDHISNNLSSVANIESGDPVFSGENDINRIYPNAGIGLFISNDKAYFGFSVPKIIQNKLGIYQGAEGQKVQK